MSEGVRVGQKVRDKLSGVEGVVLCRSEWLYGCVRITLQPEDSKDGKPYEMFTVDEPQTELVSASEPAETLERKHGPRPDPMRGHDVR